MDVEQHIRFWLDSAEHDLEAAESLFKEKKYDWCLFLGHLVLEKALKAVYVRDNNNDMPPRTHNLVKIAESTKIQFDENQIMFLDEVTSFNLEVRYPDYRRNFYKKCTQPYTEKSLNEVKDLLKWIKNNLL